MNHSTACSIACVLVSLGGLLATEPVAVAQSPLIPGWRLVWSDEFSGSVLNTAKWNTENVAWPYNNELEYYLPGQATVAGSLLNIKAERRTYGGRNYVSARINTAGKLDQQYGRFEARIWVPGGQGYWPAFWLLPSTQLWPPEIDIMETIGSRPNTVYMTQHFGTASSVQSNGITWDGPNFTTGYHRFAVEWNPTRVDWFVDGVQRFTTTANFPQEPMYVLLNLAIGGSLPGNPTASTVFPQSMLVDWVRVYMRDNALLNPGFEDAGAGTTAANWLVFGNAQQASTGQHSGAKSIRIAGNNGSGPFYSGVYQDLPASPSQVWSATGYAQHTAATRLLAGNTMYLKIEWYNAAGTQISFVQSPVLTDTSPLDTSVFGSMQATAPAGTGKARITLVMVQNATGSSAVTMDDVTFGYTSPVAIATCVADYNGIGGTSVPDIFDFLADWFASNPHADFNESGIINVQDIFDFLNSWFQGCS